MKVAVIGGGFYGCHIALALMRLGVHTTVFEKNSQILSGASGSNQFRLHLGFHYARNFRTREQSRDGFMQFIESYAHLTRCVGENLYFVPSRDSIIDFQTYKMIMTSSGLDFMEIKPPPEIKYECGCLNTPERVLLINKSRDYFCEKLSTVLELNAEVIPAQYSEGVNVGGSAYDFCIDCTWGQMSPPSGFYFEGTLLLLYRQLNDLKGERAYTFVDGPLCSLYPTEEPSIYSLSSVLYTPITKSVDPSSVTKALSSLSLSDVHQKRELMENQIKKYYPEFSAAYEYIGPQVSRKTKPIGKDDNRSCYVNRDRRVIQCLSGKIDNIFYAASQVTRLIAES